MIATFIWVFRLSYSAMRLHKENKKTKIKKYKKIMIFYGAMRLNGAMRQKKNSP
jgi:hypothetical protein